jgi:hypothetical protein
VKGKDKYIFTTGRQKLEIDLVFVVVIRVHRHSGNVTTLQGTYNLILTQILVVCSRVKNEHFDSSLELGPSEHLPDILVVIDHYGGEGPEI